MDFQEVFDSVSHRIFERKGKAFVVDAWVNNWIAQSPRGVYKTEVTYRVGVSGVFLRAIAFPYICQRHS